MYRFLIIMLPFLVWTGLKSQEFDAVVTVSSKEISGTDKRVYQDMQENLRIFINERKWTDIDFKVSERISCSFLFNIKSANDGTFEAELTVVYTRPVFNSSYSSPVLNYLDDKVVFDYFEGQSLEFSENTFTSNLTSVVGYYLYLILALDFDTMGEMGGEKFYSIAANIQSAAQGVGGPGWTVSFGERNRAELLNELMNPAYSGLRKFLYYYHRLGLDVMHENQSKAKEEILKSFAFLKEAKEKEPGLFVLELFMNTKRDEFIDIFKEGTPAEKANAVKILKELDPAHAQDYMAILRG